MKQLLFIFLFPFLIACTSTKKDLRWLKVNTVKQNIDKIESGDIIIKKKQLSIYSIFGHSALFLSKDYIAEVPKVGIGFIYSTLDDWEDLGSEIIILRFKNMNENLKQIIIKNILASSGKPYRIFFNKKRNDSHYCSQFVWEVYYRSGKKINMNIDLDSDGGPIVLPYDILHSSQLKIIDFSNNIQ